ncbi:MFS polyamine transporter [Trametes coccinea BRFM310]|uniref:MFS polyamine transporter n=1 Tax=Trametes coccinea (strain BRFM310) TaxID=1353009 RepID=A0A1Y2IL67_TRAC3|nr:MFS polyamine transporter [Trametes coccinea BRFM310]
MDRSEATPPPVDTVPESHTETEPLESQNADAITLRAEEASGRAPKVNPDVYIVDWDGPEDPENPKNWSVRKKWAVTLVVSSYAFLSPLSSSMMAPAANQIADEFGVTSKPIIALFTSIYVLGYALGPLTLAPMCELFGRARILQLSNLFYFAWNLGCGFAQNSGELIAFRFLSGIGGSAAPSIGGGVLGDVWRSDQRGQAVALYSLAPLLGPVIGPACGAWIAQRSDWRWVFWSTSIFCFFVQGIGLFYLKETYPPVLLERKAAHIRKSMVDSEKGRMQEVKTVFDGPNRQWRNLVQKALIRPFALAIYEPIIQVLAAFLSFVYGTLYLFLTTIPSIYQGVYKEDVGIAGFHYFALGIGMTAASQVNGRFMDISYKWLVARYGQQGKPEYRLPTMVPGAFMLPIGLFLTGWTARPDIHWIVPDIGIAIVGAGMILLFQSIQTYVIDAFTLHVASALASLAFFRSLAGFGFPLFAPAMYNALGYGKGDTILACVAIAIGIPAPFLFWVYGERIRNASRYAKHGSR